MKLPKVNRRNFVSLLTKAGAIGTLSLALPERSFASGEQHAEENALDDADFGYTVKPYLQSPTSTSISIMFMTNRNAYSWIEYGEGDRFDQKAKASHFGLVDANTRLNKIKLSGLKPGSTYTYRVVSKEIKSFAPYKLVYGDTIHTDNYSFKTFANKAEEVNFIVYNDIHDHPESFGFLYALDPLKNKRNDFVFMNGDMFDYQTGEQQIVAHMLQPCVETFATHTPFLYCRGNHETRGKFAREYVGYYDNLNDNFYFGFELGPAYFISLDTGEDKEDTHPVYGGIVDFDAYRKMQAEWLKKEIAKPAFKKAKYRIVFMHIPPFYSEDEHGSVHSREMFSALFDKANVDLVICGHTHTYGVWPAKPGKHNYPIIIGGGPEKNNRTLIKVSLNKQKLDLKMVREDGVEVGKFSI